MKRKKVFISLLGTGPYSETSYILGKKSMKTNYVSYFLCKEVVKPDSIIIIGTQESKWEEYPDKYFPQKYKKVLIPYGKNEEELWEGFKEVMQEIIQEVRESEVYFDITHGFRSISLFIFTVIRLINIIENAEIKGIFYGMYERGSQEAQVVDLKPMLDLDNLIYSFKTFLDYGDVYSLSEYLEKYLSGLEKDKQKDYSGIKALSKVLKTLSNAYFTNALRVYPKKISDIEDILQRQNIKSTFEKDPRMYAVSLLFDKFKKSEYYTLKGYKFENLEDYTSFASLYMKTKRFSQALEVLREGFISYLAQSCGIKESDRKKLDSLLGALQDIKDDNIEDKSIKEIVKMIRDIASNISHLRNAASHAFTSVEDDKANSMVKDIEERINNIIQDLTNLKEKGLSQEICKILIDLSEKIKGRL
ncbi:MAG: TM1812 family CRISPR-associated protein [Hydrogenobacter sp.]